MLLNVCVLPVFTLYFVLILILFVCIWTSIVPVFFFLLVFGIPNWVYKPVPQLELGVYLNQYLSRHKECVLLYNIRKVRVPIELVVVSFSGLFFPLQYTSMLSYTICAPEDCVCCTACVVSGQTQTQIRRKQLTLRWGLPCMTLSGWRYNLLSSTSQGWSWQLHLPQSGSSGSFPGCGAYLCAVCGFSSHTASRPLYLPFYFIFCFTSIL